MSAATSDISSLRIERQSSPPPNPSNSKKWLGITVLIALGLVGLYLVWKPTTIEVKVSSVVVTGGNKAPLGSITANGYVVARTKASVSARIAGRITLLKVHEGSVVKQGDILALIESADYEAQLAAAHAAVAQFEAQQQKAQRDLDRKRALHDKQLISAADLQDAETSLSVIGAQLNAARAQERLAAVNFDNTRIKAPFDGTVLRKDAEVGEMVVPQAASGINARTAIVTMADLTTLEVEVDVNEAYISQIKSEQKVRVTLDAYPNVSFSGKVRQVVPTADRQKATVQVKVSILDRDERILPEMGAKVVFLAGDSPTIVNEPQKIYVPRQAVRAGQTTTVFVVQEGRLLEKVVQIGAARGDDFEVMAGLLGGESVVLDPSADLASGQVVRIAK